MSREDLPLLTAYALGELQGAEKNRIEQMVKNDPSLQKTVKEIQETAGMLVADLRPVQEIGLSSSEKQYVEKGWRELANKESSSFFNRFFGPVPVMVSAAAAILIALAVSLPHFEKEQRRAPISEVSEPAPEKTMRAKEQATADEDNLAQKSERNAHFLKIEKKEVNPEVAPAAPAAQAPKGSAPKDSVLSEESEQVAATGVGAANGGALQGAASDKAVSKKFGPNEGSAGAGKGNADLSGPASRSQRIAAAKPKRQMALSVLFGGDGERVVGAPDTQSVKESLRAQMGDFTACYQNTLNNQPDTKGKMILKWKIKRGRATSIASASSTLGNALLESCVIEIVKKAQFGPEMNGANVTMPFHFAFQH